MVWSKERIRKRVGKLIRNRKETSEEEETVREFIPWDEKRVIGSRRPVTQIIQSWID